MTNQIKRIIIDIEYEDVYPTVPSWPVFKPLPTFPFPGYSPYKLTENFYCQKCGIQLDTVMGYVCYQFDCPTGLGGIQNTWVSYCITNLITS